MADPLAAIRIVESPSFAVPELAAPKHASHETPAPVFPSNPQKTAEKHELHAKHDKSGMSAEVDDLTAFGVSIEIARALAELRSSPPPRTVNNREWWSATVSEAIALVRDGWVAKAMRAGWSDADIFGIDPVDAYEFSGLAAWLRGRTMVFLNADWAGAAIGGVTHHMLRGGLGHGADAPRPPVMLWEFGRKTAVQAEVCK